jgi:translation initiation factor 2 beta subunit (eIF-2beta)/eIF-5
MDFSQEGGITTGEMLNPEFITSDPNFRNANEENSTVHPNSDDQTNHITRDQLQDFFMKVMQAIKAESAKQTAALQEEFRKQTVNTKHAYPL